MVNVGTEIEIEIKAPEKCTWPNVLSVSIKLLFEILNSDLIAHSNKSTVT